MFSLLCQRGIEGKRDEKEKDKETENRNHPCSLATHPLPDKPILEDDGNQPQKEEKKDQPKQERRAPVSSDSGSLILTFLDKRMMD